MKGRVSNFGQTGQLRQRVKTAHKRSHSSTLWLERQLNDPYVAAAKRDGYRSRSAYKLRELDEKFHFLRGGQMVVDLGAAPGGWSQIALSRQAKVIAIDLLPIEPLEGLVRIQADFLSDEGLAQLLDCLDGRNIDVVLSDMAASTIGHPATDQLRTLALAEAAFEFALSHLKIGGWFICKLFQGGGTGEFSARLKQAFSKVSNAKPPASRKDSVETYVVASGFRMLNHNAIE